MPSLETYRKKRNFSKTEEPRGEPRRTRSATQAHDGAAFVVQKHAARRLHYDFRLELDGVLLSWAVPKGPSFDPKVKRLAQETEPHPLDYGGFEGTIPKGEYGGGTVMVWDRGSWEPEGDARAAYQKGHLAFTLKGEKLRGRWHLVRTKGDGKAQKSWLLFKAHDELASEGAKSEVVDELPNSVLTGRDLEQIAAGKAASSKAPAKTRARKVEPHAKPDAEQPAKPKASRRVKGSQTAKGASANYPLTNPDKVLYPDCGITKRELLAYYELVAERMLPHVANRPLTLVRCPNGVGRPCFFQKHPGEGNVPGLRSVAIREREGKAPYSVIDDVTGLFGLAQLGALEIHTWGSRAYDFERPDLLVFDLDPDTGLDFAEVITCARRVREIFEAAKMQSFVKTTGGKGLHVCIPFEPDLGWDAIKDFTGRLAEALAAQYPNQYLATQSKAKRKGKIFIDFLRNGRGATFIAPYSTRAREGAPIAVPLEWDELESYSPAEPFTVRNIAQRLKRQKTDPFARMITVRQRLRPQAISD